MNVQEAKENFDLAFISLEIDALPHLGGTRISDGLLSQLGKILDKGQHNLRKRIHPDHPVCPILLHRYHRRSSSSMPTSISSRAKASPPEPTYECHPMDVGMSYADLGSTDFGNMVPRERFLTDISTFRSDVPRGSNPDT